MKWIGLTGGLGSGKSSVGMILRSLGFPVLDADRIAQAVLRPGTQAHQELEQAFGKDIFMSDGTLDRAKLSKVVFGDAAALARLEAISHPRVRAWVADERALWASRGFRLAFYDVPLLYEKKLDPEFDKVIVVTAAEGIRMQRVLLRNQMPEGEFRRRESFQMPLSEKEKRADFVIRNEGSLINLEAEVCNITSQLLAVP